MDGAKHPRECASCTACCDGWIRVVVNGQLIGFGRPCPHRTDKGCGIYDERPVNPCRTFKCGWLIENSPLPDWMRPDKCGAITMLGKYKLPKWEVDAAVPAASDGIRKETLEWLQNFAFQNGRALLIVEPPTQETSPQQTRIRAFGPDDFKQYIGTLIRSRRFSLISKDLVGGYQNERQ